MHLGVIVKNVEPGPELSKVQRNQLYRAVEEGGLSVVECDLAETFTPGHQILVPGLSVLNLIHLRDNVIEFEGQQEAQIAHLPSGSAYNIRSYSFSAASMLNYSGVGIIGGEERLSGTGWSEVLESVRQWAMLVKRECVDPDLWEVLRRGRLFLAGSEETSHVINSPFTDSEQTEIAAQLRFIKDYVKKTYNLSIEQVARVEARLDEAEEASHYLGRKDWILLFSGAVFTLFLTAVVPPEVVQHVLMMAAHGIGHLFGQQSPPEIRSQG